MLYYGDNADKTFKVYTSLAYDTEAGIFAPVTGSRTVTLANGTTLTVDNAALANLIGGNLIDTDPAKVEASVNKLTGSMDTLIGQALAASVESGSTFFDTDEGFISFLSGLGILGTLTPEQKANALVLYAASKSDAIDTASIVNAMATGGSLGLDSFMAAADDSGALIATASTAYAMMYAYANSGADIKTEIPGSTKEVRLNKMGLLGNPTQEELNDWLNSKIASGEYPEGSTINLKYKDDGSVWGGIITTPTTTTTQAASEWFAEQTSGLVDIYSVDEMFQSIRSNEGFQQYVAANGGADMNAFLGSMQLVNDNVQSSNVQSILDYGWTNGGVGDWLLQILNDNP